MAQSQPLSQPLARPVGGEAFAARLTGIDGDWKLSFATGPATRTLPAGDSSGRVAPELDRGPLIVLADGSVFVADVRNVEGDRLIADSILFGEVTLPLWACGAQSITRPPSDSNATDCWTASRRRPARAIGSGWSTATCWKAC